MNTPTIHLEYPDDATLRRLDALRADLASRFDGLPYLFARMSYGNELTLHFGEQRGYTSPKLAGKNRGTHVLSVRGSAWLLISGVSPLMVGCGLVPKDVPADDLKPFNASALECGAIIGGSTRIKAIEPVANVGGPEAIGLAILFDNGSQFLVIPTPTEYDKDGKPIELADWEFLTPTELVKAGPGVAFTIEPLG